MRPAFRFARPLGLVCALAGLTRPAVAQEPATHSSGVWGVTFARDEASVATVARGEVRVWMLPSGVLACRLDGPFGNARVEPDGPAGFLVVTTPRTDGRIEPTDAYRLDVATCARTPVALAPGLVGANNLFTFVVTAPDGRQLPGGFSTPAGSVLAIRSTGSAFTVELPGGHRLASASRPFALEDGDTVYTCTAEGRRFLFHRTRAGGRPESLGRIDQNEYGNRGCGTLALTPDRRLLLNAAGGTVVDLGRRRVRFDGEAGLGTSMAIDDVRGQAFVAGPNGVTVLDARSGRSLNNLNSGSGSYGYVSPGGAYIALSNSVWARPLVQIRPRSGSDIALDDARSRSAADILVARNEAETQARADEARRRQVAEAAADAELTRAAEALVAGLGSVIERVDGRVSVRATLRQIQYQGGYDWIAVALRRGDVVVLATQAARTATFSIKDVARNIEVSLPATTAPGLFDGYSIARTRMDTDVSGDLVVQSNGLPVHVFVVRAADVRR